MGAFADCQDARNMKTIMEITCPKCHEEDGIEVILKEGSTVGESVCAVCGYVVPEGTNLGEFMEE